MSIRQFCQASRHETETVRWIDVYLCHSYKIMSKNKTQRIFWSSAVFATLIGCGILLYFSYIYEGNFLTSCENCNRTEIISTQQAEKLIQEECQRICHSKECVIAANFILENMDEGIDPCEDFYSFSCGSWMKQFSKDDNYSVVDGMGKTLKLAIKDILDNLKGPPESAVSKLKIMYNSCMNEQSSDWDAISATVKFLEQCGFQNWQNLSIDHEFHFSLNNSLAKMAAYNEFAFVIFKPTYHEPDEHILNDNLLKLTITPGYPL
ncbi:endothelin-converting enzyme 1 [Nephila pilipes]|uniref:Endothelin-converting enzyme 1 n=1 Tax=Nephila pilipes TaxID=299642 RepID=A0A8X6NLR7_NEPPI|nr:endothelin-converting enzyme 1 [Nephila pilipes]